MPLTRKELAYPLPRRLVGEIPPAPLAQGLDGARQVGLAGGLARRRFRPGGPGVSDRSTWAGGWPGRSRPRRPRRTCARRRLRRPSMPGGRKSSGDWCRGIRFGASRQSVPRTRSTKNASCDAIRPGRVVAVVDRLRAIGNQRVDQSLVHPGAQVDAVLQVLLLGGRHHRAHVDRRPPRLTRIVHRRAHLAHEARQRPRAVGQPTRVVRRQARAGRVRIPAESPAPPAARIPPTASAG